MRQNLSVIILALSLFGTGARGAMSAISTSNSTLSTFWFPEVSLQNSNSIAPAVPISFEAPLPNPGSPAPPAAGRPETPSSNPELRAPAAFAMFESPLPNPNSPAPPAAAAIESPLPNPDSPAPPAVAGLRLSPNSRAQYVPNWSV
jgi:hypothetical protein